MYGSGATNLVEVELVLASGEVVTANRCSHPELFRALRGGGGAFGIVTRATYRTFPWPETTGYANGKLEGDMVDSISRFGRWYRKIVQQGLAKHFGGQVQIG